MFRTLRRSALPLAVAALLTAGAGPAPAQVVVAPVVTTCYSPPVVSYYAAPTVSYYTPAPVVSYYTAPTVSYYAAPTVSYYAVPTVSYYAPVYAGPTVTTYRYGLFGRRTATVVQYP